MITARRPGGAWLRLVLVVGLSLGLVAMHHLVAAPGGHDRAMSAGVPSGHDHALSVAAPSAQHGALSAAPPCDCSPAAMAGHPCLAVLTGVVAVVVTLLAVPGAGMPGLPRAAASWRTGIGARAPPLPRRLAVLQVLRL